MMIYELLAKFNPVIMMFVVLPALIVASVLIIKALMDANSKRLMTGGGHESSKMVLKKYSAVDIYKNTPIAAGVGLALTFMTVIAIFEYPIFDEIELVDLGPMELNIEEQIELPPPTEHKPPPPPKIKQPEIVEVPDEKEIEQEIEVELDTEVDEQQVVEAPIEFDINSDAIETAPAPEEKVEQVFEFLQDPAAFPGGQTAMMKFIQKNFDFPRQARRLGIEGKVYVRFVVDTDGSITNVEVARGVHELLDEEAIRVVKAMPKWKPGKQRGRAVKQRMTIPIDCRLR